jgi:hypothetical protein
VIQWWRRFRRAAIVPSVGGAEPAHEAPGDAGEYQSLYVYLRDRYADRVVLSFADIEALLGFPLPAPARAQPEWWSDADPPGDASAQSRAWMLASRTAIANVDARTVIFDRRPHARQMRS